MNIVQQIELLKRGAVEVYTEEELAQKLVNAEKTGKPLRVKLGLDPTSPDIHLGHTVVLRKMRQFQDLGHKAVLIIGDYTARIGDPTGVNATRPILTPEQITANAATYFQQAGKILDTSEDKLEVRYNGEWFETMTLMEMIHLAAKKTITQMLQRDTFKQRLAADKDVYIHEFLYPLMQGYDSVMIRSDVELGGTDQTFNNLVGRDIQRSCNQSPQIVLTMPILVGLDGVEKMSKSKGNYIGVTDGPGDMFGKVMSISDEMMVNYFTLLTDLPAERIAELTDGARTHPKHAKVLLGKTIVAQFHGPQAAEAAAEEFERVFARKQLPDDILEVAIAAEPVMAFKLLVACNLAPSSGEAKRIIKQGGATLDGNKLTDPNAEIQPQTGMILRVGKLKFARLKTP